MNNIESDDFKSVSAALRGAAGSPFPECSVFVYLQVAECSVHRSKTSTRSLLLLRSESISSFFFTHVWTFRTQYTWFHSFLHWHVWDAEAGSGPWQRNSKTDAEWIDVKNENILAKYFLFHVGLMCGVGRCRISMALKMLIHYQAQKRLGRVTRPFNGH